MILKNVMNDLYARDTSAKIKDVKRSIFWNDVTIKSVLRNEVYLGHMVKTRPELSPI